MIVNSPAEIIRAALECLRLRRPVFHLEADFCHELACELSGWGLSPVRVGVPVMIGEMRRRVDIIAGNIAIEVKYFLAEFGPISCLCQGEEFSCGVRTGYRDRHAFWEDVRRLETMNPCAKGFVIKHGFAIMLTNRKAMWSGRQKDAWTYEGCTKTTCSGKTYTPEWGCWAKFGEARDNLHFRYAIVEAKRN